MDDYDLEIDRIVKEIKAARAKKVCLQLPDGLEPKATEIVDELKAKCKGVEFYIWAGSNFGACDVPIHLEKFGFDLLINFGHAVFKK